MCGARLAEGEMIAFRKSSGDPGFFDQQWVISCVRFDCLRVVDNLRVMNWPWWCPQADHDEFGQILRA